VTAPTTWIALVVDDDETRACTVADGLRGDALDVRVATRVANVLDTVESPGVDIVVANVRLAGTSAPELLRSLRARDSDLPVVFVHEWPAATSAEMSALAGAVITAVRHRIQRRTRRRTTTPPVHPFRVIVSPGKEV
jgi:DNA-binding response OmpR family regulator